MCNFLEEKSSNKSTHMCRVSDCDKLSCSMSTGFRPYVSDLVRMRLIDNFVSPGSLPSDNDIPLHKKINHSSNPFPRRYESTPLDEPTPPLHQFGYQHNTWHKQHHQLFTPDVSHQFSHRSSPVKASEVMGGEVMVFNLEF